jgi:uncharacterized protein (TIGR02217 family)
MGMIQPNIAAVNVIPASGEFTYDTVAYSGAYQYASMLPINTYFAPGGAKTDFSYALDQLQEWLPNCQFVALVVQWMGNDLNVAKCKIYPSSTYLGGAFQPTAGGTDSWRVSGLTLASAGLIPISRPDGIHSAYGGTCSDQSVVRAIQAVKARGLKVNLYLQMNMDAPGQPWRGLCTYAPDISSAATTAIEAFLGSASPSQFTPDSANLTVAYSGAPLDFTYRRFVLHYANLAVVAGGVNMFVIGSELRGLEAVRGPAWTPAGTTDAAGHAVWDYPFVAGLQTLIDDCRGIFDNAGFAKNLAARENLITYSADWSQWMGAQHDGVAGIFPHLDPLFAQASVDLVSFDNYMPLSDWTTGDGGLDARNWRLPIFAGWPHPDPATVGFGLDGAPDIHDIRYLKGNIEHGEKFDYYYGDYTSSNILDPNGSLRIVTAPQGDRGAQARNPYFAGQELFAFKNIRWWWNDTHRAVYDAGDGLGPIPHGPHTAWVPQSKSIMFMEYGFASIDRDTNEENLFYDPNSVAGGTPFWCLWRPVAGGGYLPVQDLDMQFNGHKAWYEYWVTDGNNAMSSAGAPMIATDMMFAWNWDARPFPVFPDLLNIWGDGVNWPAGMWLAGKGPATMPPTPPVPPTPDAYATFPTLATLEWSTHVKPRFATEVAAKVSGRSARSLRYAAALYDVELGYDVLRSDAAFSELQTIADFFGAMRGQAAPFWLAPPSLADIVGQPIGLGDGVTATFPLTRGFGAYSEPVAGTSGVAAVYVNGVAVSPSLYAVSSGYLPAITFTTPPASGATIFADFGLLWLCRFAEDIVDFEEFMATLFTLGVVKLQTVRL